MFWHHPVPHLVMLRDMRRSRFLLVLVLLTLVACGAVDGSDTTEPSTEEPAGEKSGSAKIGTQSPSIVRIPTYMTIDRMNELGYELELVEFESTSTQMQAAVSGAIDIPTAGAAGAMTAMDGGYEGKLFLGMFLNEFTLLSSGEFTTCESLDGQTVAIHAQISTDALIAIAWFEETCPEAEPELVVIEGSENRLVALIEGQVTAATLGIDNLAQLEHEYPGEYHVVANFVEEYPTYSGAFAATPEFMSENEEMLKDLIRIHLEVWDEVYSDPEILVREAEELLPEIEPEVIALMAATYLEAGIFPRDGGLDPALTQLTLDVASDAVEGFTTLASIDDVMDRTLLDSVLAEG